MWRLKNRLLNNQQTTEEIKIKKEIKIHIGTNENENMTSPNLWNSIKAVLEEMFRAMQAYLEKHHSSEEPCVSFLVNDSSVCCD